MPTNHLLLLTHIPKCAGTSFREVFIENDKDKLVAVAPRGIKELRLISQDFQYITGHFPFGVERFINAQSPAARRTRFRCVFLRDPLEQMVSLYHHNNRQGEVVSSQLIHDYFGRNRHLANMQVQYCAGVFPYLLENRIWLPARRRLQLWRAQMNLRKFDYVGFQQTFDEDVEAIAGILKIEPPKNRVLANQNPVRPPVNSVPADALDKLKKLAKFDLALFAFAQRSVRNGKGQ